MITKLIISNFRSLGPNVEIKPGSLNFLVGANGSGKSNILRALTFVREAVRMGLPGAITNNNGIESIRRYSSGRPRNVKIEIEAKVELVPAGKRRLENRFSRCTKKTNR